MQTIPFGDREGKKIAFVSSMISFGVYFSTQNNYKYHFFIATQSKLDEIDKIVLDILKTVEFTEPIIMLSHLIGDTFKEHFDSNLNFKISYPEEYEVKIPPPREEIIGENPTENSSVLAIEFKFSPQSDFGITARVFIERTKIKFADYIELFKLQLTKSRVLLAAVKEVPTKLSNVNAVEFRYSTSNVNHISRIIIFEGRAAIVSIDHFGVDLLDPGKLFESIFKSFKLFPRSMKVPVPLSIFKRYESFDYNYSISFPDFCHVVFSSANTVFIGIKGEKVEYNGLFIQVLDFSKEEQTRPSVAEITSELADSFKKTCSLVYQKDVEESESTGQTCQQAEFLFSGTWFVNPILNHPHEKSQCFTRVIESNKLTFLLCFINLIPDFSGSWDSFGARMVNSLRLQ